MGRVPKFVKQKIEQEGILVARSGGQNVGYLRLEYLSSKLPYIGLIRVAEDSRGQGIGKEMLAFLESILKQKGYDSLMSSSQTNEPRAGLAQEEPVRRMRDHGRRHRRGE